MTEEKAKTKWCPMAREIKNSSNGIVSHNHNTVCIASDCMMWRWNRDIMVGGSGRAEPTQGYCGLAGKP